MNYPMKSLKHAGIAFFCFLVAGCSTHTATHMRSATPQIVSVKKIWDQGGHNAFTDLIRFRDRWFCTFRESESHLTGFGKIRVLVSRDGDNWETAAALAEDGIDLRDPKFSITPDGRLMLVFGGTVRKVGKATELQSRVAFSTDGFTWSEPVRVLGIGDWLWRVTWHGGRAYGVAYNTAPSSPKNAPGSTARLVTSADGIHFTTLVDFNISDRPNEATARFVKNGDCVVLIRREAGDKSAWIGVSAAPYTDWKWKPAGMFVGGPNFLVMPDGSLIASGRMMDAATKSPKTFIGKMDFNSVTPEFTLPSGGDCSYPGLLWHNGLLWVSYYSTHEGKTSIYLAKVKLWNPSQKQGWPSRRALGMRQPEE